MPGNPLIEQIRIRSARTHNLKNIDVDLPRNRLVTKARQPETRWAAEAIAGRMHNQRLQ